MKWSLLHIAVLSSCFAPIISEFISDCEVMDGVSNKRTITYRGNCLVFHTGTTLAYSEARLACNDFKHGGHLAFVPSVAMFNAINEITKLWSGGQFYIGLEHGGANDTKIDWWWKRPNGEKYEAVADITPWDIGKPGSAYSSVNDACVNVRATNGGLRDASCVPRHYICQYGRTHRGQFKEVKGGKIPPGSVVIANATDISNMMACARTCSINTFCYSFAYNGNTGNCLIVPLLVDEIPNPVASTDYENYDKV